MPMMKVWQVIERLQKLPRDADVRLGISFTRDSAEDEGYADAPLVRIYTGGKGPKPDTVIFQGSEDAGVAEAEGDPLL